MRISSRILSVSDAPIERVNRERILLESKDRPILNLGQAIPDFGPPPVCINGMIRATKKGETHVYTPGFGLPDLREATARKLRRFYASVQKEEIIITAGANHAFLLVCSVLLDPGDCVGLLSPYFLNHKMAVAGCGGIAVEILPDSDYAYSAATIERAIIDHQLRALIFVNPSNPTGKVFGKGELQFLVEICRKYGIWLISDEVYSAFVYSPARMTSLVSFPGATDYSFTIGSFSKEFGMTGWRLGWVRAPKSLMSHFLKVQDYSIICAPRAAQVMALVALEEAPDWADRHLDELEMRRQVLWSALDTSGLFRTVASDGAFFVWFRPHEEVDSEREVIEMMRHERICIIPGVFFGENWRGWFRVSYGCQGIDAIRIAARRLVKYFQR